MPFSISDLATVNHTLSNLNDLIRACRVRGRFYGHDNELTRDVLRKAKGLQTSLGKLKEALDDPHHQPIKEDTMPKQSLSDKLYWVPAYTELTRFIGYDGRRATDLKEKCDELRKQHGNDKVMWALVDLTVEDKATGLTVLKPQAKKLARQLLGPPPEEPPPVEHGTSRTERPMEHLPIPVTEATVEATSPAIKQARYEPSNEALEAFERLEHWLLDARGKPQTELAEQTLRYLASALLEGKNSYSHAAEDNLEAMKLRNGKTEGDDIPEGVNAAEDDDFQRDVEDLLNLLHERMLDRVTGHSA